MAAAQEPLPVGHTPDPAAAPAPLPLMLTTGAVRDTCNRLTLGSALNARVKTARVLMVGAGGIGCELLKTLVLSGFGEIHIVDLDTIDLSNLNRQFLFRHEHIRKPKATVARDTAQRFNPFAKLVAHHTNIKNCPPFDTSFFRSFDIVFNALDNLDARRHVNRMCLAADVPLIESGTTGFNGQVQVIRRGVTACYDCSPKEAPKSYPVCTIRSTPSQPIHCIVWGKNYLLSEMFGDSEDESAFDNAASDDNAGEIEELRKESNALKELRQAVGTPSFAQMLFDKVFYTDILRLRSMGDMWQSRPKPDALTYAEAQKDVAVLLGDDEAAARVKKDKILHNGQGVWSLAESVVVFTDSIGRLALRATHKKTVDQPAKAVSSNGASGIKSTNGTSGSHGPATPTAAEPVAEIVEFDKDDIDTLDFVAASANIRATLFGIERKSRFDIKQMAGNIIPAIATANAIVSGLCVLQAFKVLRGEYDHVREVFLTPFASDHLLAADASRPPNPECPVCSAHQVSVRFDRSATLSSIITEIVRGYLGYDEDRDITITKGGDLLYDFEETIHLEQKLCDIVNPGEFLTVTDDSDVDPYVNVSISLNLEPNLIGHGSGVEVISPEDSPEVSKRPRRHSSPTAKDDSLSETGAVLAVDDDDDLILVDGPAEPATKASASTVQTPPSLEKRLREEDENNEPDAKRARVNEAADSADTTSDGASNALAVNDKQEA